MLSVKSPHESNYIDHKISNDFLPKNQYSICYFDFAIHLNRTEIVINYTFAYTTII